MVLLLNNLLSVVKRIEISMVAVILMLNLTFALQIRVVDEAVVLRSPQLEALLKPSAVKVESLQKEIESLSQKFKNLQREFEANAAIMDEKSRKERSQALNAHYDYLQHKFIALQEEISVIKQKEKQFLEDACTKLATKEELDIIFSKKRGILCASPKLDVTNQVMQLVSDNTKRSDNQSSVVQAESSTQGTKES